jgi:hypothetical protein
LIVMLKSLMNHGRDSIYTRIDVRGAGKLFESRTGGLTLCGWAWYRCTEMEAALGLAQLDARGRRQRRQCARRLCAGLARRMPFNAGGARRG